MSLKQYREPNTRKCDDSRTTSWTSLMLVVSCSFFAWYSKFPHQFFNPRLIPSDGAESESSSCQARSSCQAQAKTIEPKLLRGDDPGLTSPSVCNLASKTTRCTNQLPRSCRSFKVPSGWPLVQELPRPAARRGVAARSVDLRCCSDLFHHQPGFDALFCPFLISVCGWSGLVRLGICVMPAGIGWLQPTLLDFGAKTRRRMGFLMNKRGTQYLWMEGMAGRNLLQLCYRSVPLAPQGVLYGPSSPDAFSIRPCVVGLFVPFKNSKCAKVRFLKQLLALNLPVQYEQYPE